MIRVVGAQDTAEYKAARKLSELIVEAWPSVATDPAHDICLVANAKCHGQPTRDVDIVLLATLAPGLEYTAFLPFETPSGQIHRSETVQVSNLCLAIEVKDHPPQAVRFVGTAVEVQYNGKWHSASEQNEKQVFAVKGYAAYHGVHTPWVRPLVWLRNVPNTALPARPHPIIGAQITWELILNVVAQLRPPHLINGQWVLGEPGFDRATMRRLADLFAKVLEPTQIDRKRMERINQQSVDVTSILKDVGSKQIILRGRGGTGKTMRLLQIAKRLYDDEGARVLILTYNKALVADIRRLLTILGIGDDLTGNTIHIQTVHSFIYAVMQGLGLLTTSSVHFLEEYERLKDEALEFLRLGLVQQSDLEKLIKSDFEAFQWDYLLIDEGQDWPANERDILWSIYPKARLIIADGIDQLIRSETPADWRYGLTASQFKVIALRESLRMKAGLARFVSAVAHNLGLMYTEWQESPAIPGGRVIVLEGSYFHDRALHDRLIHDNRRDGNENIDMLYCVPPGLGASGFPRSQNRSVAARAFEEWGFQTWDGVAEDVRESYPTDVEQLRIVQYESCRGLEGWIVVNLAFDQLYEVKLAALSPARETRVDKANRSSDAISMQVARWLMIPLTRAMDTLVIHLEQNQSPVRDALSAAALEYADVVEWITR